MKSASTPTTISASFIKPRVVSIKPMQGSGNLKAFASVEFGFGLTMHELRIVQQPGQQAWVGAPCRQWTDPHGNKRFAAILEFDKPLQEAISLVVLEAYELAMAGEEVADA